MINKIVDNITGSKKIIDEIKIMYFYRYFSLILTSIFYLVSNFKLQIYGKLMTIFCLTIASILLNHLYLKVEYKKKNIVPIIIMEVIGNTLILIPTGGINSPYIWYSLNTVLITVYYIGSYYCIFNLLFYIVGSTEISYLIFDKEGKGFLGILYKNSNLILSLILITVAVQLLLGLAKKLNKERRNLVILNNQLLEANEEQNETMNHIMSLYQAVNSLTNYKNKDEFLNILLFYTKEITKSPIVFYSIPNYDSSWKINISEKEYSNFEDILLERINTNLDKIMKSTVPINILIENKNFNLVKFKYSNRFYGILGVEVYKVNSSQLYNQSFEQLKFLSSLATFAFERFELEKINESLLISEEQNRIANEIHDSVTQRLFAISCCVHNLTKRIDGNLSNRFQSEFENIRDSLNKAMKELRETIYGLSTEKNGKSPFTVSIKEYLEDLERLHGIRISYNIIGNEEVINVNVKKALYRIICESAGNAIRHGKCSLIDININIKKDFTELVVQDNGKGFDLKNKMYSNELGLGIKNILNLVYSFNGEIDIESKLGGTIINISLPNYIFNKAEEDAI